ELFEALLRTGRPIGQAVRAVNASLRDGGIDHPCFVLFGDPMMTLAGRSPASRSSVEWRAGGDGQLLADVPPDGSGPYEVPLPDEVLAGGWRIVAQSRDDARGVRCVILPHPPAGCAS